MDQRVQGFVAVYSVISMSVPIGRQEYLIFFFLLFLFHFIAGSPACAMFPAANVLLEPNLRDWKKEDRVFAFCWE